MLSGLQNLCTSIEAPVHLQNPPQSYLFRYLYAGNLIRKAPSEYTAAERKILTYEPQLLNFLPEHESLVSSEDPPSLFPLTRGSYVAKHSHKHICSAYVASIILENQSNDEILVWPRGSEQPERLILAPGSLLLMAGDCEHSVEEVTGQLAVLAFDFCYARYRLLE
jgi:hypothetical protein